MFNFLKSVYLTRSVGDGGPVLNQNSLSTLHHGWLLHMDRTTHKKRRNII